MPKVVTDTLIWSPERQEYALSLKPGKAPIDIVPEGPGWLEWLDQVSSFVFIGKAGRCTVRKENRQRGDVYWYAYHSKGKQLSKRYVGKTRDLTLAHLEAIVEVLSSQRRVAEPSDPNIDHPPTDSQEEPVGQPDAAPVQAKMDPLLATKLRIPRPRVQAVSRMRLFTQLERGTQGSLTLISAPVGFGKTTLLTQWLAEIKLPVAWLSLEPEDNQPTRFLSYMIAALQKLDPGIGSTSLPPLRSPQPPALESVLTLLTNEIATSQVEPMLLVLDDYHVISSEAIHRTIIFLLEHLPSQLHLIMLTRADPLLPLARLRARGQLTELRANDLRFDTAEAGLFLHDVMNVDMAADDLHLLEQRTEGWVAGLQLAALSLRGKQDISVFLRTFSGSNRFILDYLGDEVLSRQPEPVLTFLLHTCMLDRLCSSLCSALLSETAGYSPGECQAMLEALEKSNLFVNPLDDEQCWYRYHQLFATVLQARLSQTLPRLAPVLHLRASVWFEQHSYIHEAIHHALEIQDVARLTSLLRPIVWDLLSHGEWDVLCGWLQRLPGDLEKTQPQLCLYHAAALAFPGQATAAEGYLQYAEQQPHEFTNHPNTTESSPQSPQLILSGEIAVVRMVIALVNGDLTQASTAGEHARTHLPQEQIFLRSIVAGTESLVYATNGDFRTAIQCLWEARTIAQQVDNPFTFHRAMTAFAFCLLHLGQLSQVISIGKEILQLAIRPGGKTLPFAGMLCVILGTGYYEINEMEAAKKVLRQGIELCKQMGEVQFLSNGYAQLAQVLYLEQIKMHPGSAPTREVRELIQQAEVLLWKESPVVLWAKSPTAYCLVRLWILQGDRDALARLEQFYPIDEQVCSTPGCSYPMQMDARGLAYIYFGQQKFARIIPLLHWPMESAEQNERITALIRMLIVQSMAYAMVYQMPDALNTLKKALQVGEPEKYINAFVEMGQPMAKLLQILFVQEQIEGSSNISLSYMQALLHEFNMDAELLSSQPQTQTAQQSSTLIESLTEREMEVLRLMGSGLSNAEIARKMVVEVSTVKWHIHHIYDKLQVSNRAQAILRAQAMSLL